MKENQKKGYSLCVFIIVVCLLCTNLSAFAGGDGLGTMTNPVASFGDLLDLIGDDAVGTSQAPKEIYLTGMLEATQELAIKNGQYIKLIGIGDGENGLKRSARFSDGDMIDVGDNDAANECALTLENIVMDGGAVWSDGAGSENSGIAAGNSSLISVRAKATLNLNAGSVLRNNEKTGGGAGVWLVGTMNISGGKIIYNSAAGSGSSSRGGGVNLSKATGRLYLYDGEISYNYSNEDGGGVNMHNESSNGGEFIMYGGKINHNRVRSNSNKAGGAMRISAGLFEMRGGEICNNFAAHSGSAIRFGNDNKNHVVRLLGGKISGNTIGAGAAGASGGFAAIWVPHEGTLELGNVDISGNAGPDGEASNVFWCLEDDTATAKPIQILAPLTSQISVALPQMPEGAVIAQKGAGFDGAFSSVAEKLAVEGSDVFGFAADGDNIVLRETTIGCGCEAEDAFIKGNGEAETPFRIETAGQLRHIEQHAGAGVYFRLMDHIDLSGEWEPLCANSAFAGSFDGNGCTISGLCATGGSLGGLFAHVAEGGVIYDLTIEGEIEAGRSMKAAGGVAAMLDGTVENVTSGVHINIGSQAKDITMAGGIAGYSTGMVSGCTYSGSITDARASSGGYVGAMIGCANIARPEGLPDMITAHAGFAAPGGADDKSEDNTLDSIIKSINYYPEAVEVDVQTNGAGELWLGHDGVGTNNPSLEDVLKLLMGQHERSGELNDNGSVVRIQLDAKTDGLLDEILALAEKVNFPWERLILAGNNSYDHVMENIAAIRSCVNQGMEFWMNPDYILSYDALISDMDGFIARIDALQLPRFTVNSNYNNITDAVLERFSQEGITVSLWTLNSEEAIASNLLRGVYNTTSRLPRILEVRKGLIEGVAGNAYDESAGLPEVGSYADKMPEERRTPAITVSEDPDKYTLSFETNGGSGIGSVSVLTGTTVSLSGYQPVKSGYVFDGWYTDAGLTEPVTALQITSDRTVYAGWTQAESGAAKLPFTDVTEGDWFHDDVAYVYEKGLMRGTDNNAFEPDLTTTRGMIVAILYRLEGNPAVTGPCSFNDVKAGCYQDAIIWAGANKIVDGYGDGSFGPDDNVTREQMAAILWRYARYKGYDVSVGEDTDILSYNDALDISVYATPAMQWACGAGLIQGSDGELMPAGNAARSQVAAILHRFCELPQP